MKKLYLISYNSLAFFHLSSSLVVLDFIHPPDHIQINAHLNNENLGKRSSLKILIHYETLMVLIITSSERIRFGYEIFNTRMNLNCIVFGKTHYFSCTYSHIYACTRSMGSKLKNHCDANAQEFRFTKIVYIA